MKKPTAWLTLFLLFGASTAPAPARALKVTASADKTQLSLNESFVFTIRIESQKNSLEGAEIPDLSHLNDFQLLNQWSERESSFQIAGGQRQSLTAFSKNWRFQPKTTGTLRIEPLTVKAQGHEFQTPAIFVTVHPAEQGPPSQPNPPPLPDPFGFPALPDIFDNLTQKPPPKDHRETVKLLTDLKKRSFYKRERIPLSWLLLSSSGSLQFQTEKRPELKGFWKEEAETRQAFLGTQVINKVLYRKTSIEKLYLFPLQSGELTIDPYSLKIYFSSGFFGLASPSQIRSSPSKKITVKDLPPAGRKPAEWTGAVGSFKLKARLHEKTALSNEPISYSISFQGTGHPRFIRLPDLPFPDNARIWPPAEKSRFSESGEGFKEFTFLISAREEGRLTIPSFRLSSFDPESESYVVHETRAFSIPVQKGQNAMEKSESYFETDKDEKKSSLDLRPLKIGGKPTFLRHKNLVFLETGLLACFSAILLWFYVRKLVLRKKKSPKKQFEKELKAVEKLLRKKQVKPAIMRLININYSLLYSLQEGGSSKSFSNWRQALTQLPPALQKKYAPGFEGLFRELELLSFSPEARQKKEPGAKIRDLLKRTQSLSKKLFP